MKRKRVTISVRESLLDWADKVVEEGYRFKDRSHVFEFALAQLKEKDDSSR